MQINIKIKDASGDPLRDKLDASSFDGCLWLRELKDGSAAIALWFMDDDDVYVFQFADATMPETAYGDFWQHDGKMWEWSDYVQRTKIRFSTAMPKQSNSSTNGSDFRQLA